MDSKKRVLFAEDEEINYLYIKEVLSYSELEVVHAWNGKELLDIFLKDSSFDIILMDIKMPVINGYEAVVECKKINSKVPIIAVTAHALTGDKDKILSAGFDDYISKPVDEQSLLTVIHNKIK